MISWLAETLRQSLIVYKKDLLLEWRTRARLNAPLASTTVRHRTGPWSVSTT